MRFFPFAPQLITPFSHLDWSRIRADPDWVPAFVAQRIEHLTTDQKVGGSSPSKRTFRSRFMIFRFCKLLSSSRSKACSKDFLQAQVN